MKASGRLNGRRPHRVEQVRADPSAEAQSRLVW